MRRLLTLISMCLFAYSLSGQVFRSDVRSSIPDDGDEHTYSLNVSGIGELRADFGIRNVKVDIQHDWPADLVIEIISPEGQRVHLSSDNGVGHEDYYSMFTFDIAASVNVVQNPEAIALPEGNLRSFNMGTQADGEWKLVIRDDMLGEQGYIDSWSIEFAPLYLPPPNPTNQDCPAAIPVCQDIYSQTNSYSGTGNIPNEIDWQPSCMDAGEKNDVWYVFTVQTSGYLNFSITPNSWYDDYDWAVYNLTNNSCSDIFSVPSLEVSCNWSPNIGCGGVTGPNNQHNGPCGGQNEEQFWVNAGETFVLNVSNYSSTQFGYNLDFTASTAQIYDNVPPQLDALTSTPDCGTTTIDFDFSENIMCSTVEAADFTVTGPGGPYTVTAVSGAQCVAGAPHEKAFTITVSPAFTTNGNYNLNLVTTSGSVEDVCGNTAAAGSLPFTINGVQTNIIPSSAPSCYGDTDGWATVSISGGSTPYTIQWDAAAGNQTTATATGLGDGTYIVEVTDNKTCTARDTITLTEPAELVANATSTDETCSGRSDGALSGSVTSGGVSPFSYSWNTIPASGTQNVSNVAPGSYQLIVTDANNCKDTTSTTISTGVVVNSGFNYNGNQCVSGNAYTFTNTGTSGGGISHSWDFGDGSGTSTQENPTYNYASAGTFTVRQIVRSGSCADTTEIAVTVYDEPDITSVVTITDASCNGDCDGAVDVTTSGGASPYSYSWSNSETTQDISGLCAGSYTLIATDQNGCKDTLNATVNEPGVLAVTASGTDPSCNGVCDGSATTVVSGGTGPFTYQWSHAQGTASSASGLCAGVGYVVTVTDAGSCTARDTVTLSEPPVLTLSLSGTDPACNGVCDGSITTTVGGGTSPYTYAWTDGKGTASNATGLCANEYYAVVVTDNGGCTIADSLQLSEPSAVDITLTETIPNCFNGCDGQLAASVTGGTGAYSYSWSGGVGSSATATGLCAGLTYTLTVTDANGCTDVEGQSISNPADINLSVTTDVLDCNGDCDGSLTATATGGNGGFTYAWNAAAALQTGATASSLCAGSYGVTVTDSKGCQKAVSGNVTEPLAITLATGFDNATCNSSNGKAWVSASGGAGGYAYSWTTAPVQTTDTAFLVAAGSYTVTVTDASGCSNNTTVNVTDAGAPTISVDATTNVSCNGGTDGAATVSAAGGSGGYVYSWNTAPVQNGVTANSLSAGTYVVTVTDAATCVVTENVTITEPDALSSTISSQTAVSCYGGSDGTATVSVTGGTTAYTYSWNTAPAQTTVTATGLDEGNHDVYITDAEGCLDTATVTIVQPDSLDLTVVVTDVSCNGEADGTIDLTVSGGTTNYSYLWSNGETQEDVTNLAGGSYSVTVTDANGCTKGTSATILEKTAINLSMSKQDPYCGQSNGWLEVSAAGGEGSYTYNWDAFAGSQTTARAINLAAGNYSVRVTDGDGCEQLVSGSLADLPAGSLAIVVVNEAGCNGACDGSLVARITGGYEPFTFLWNDPSAQTDSVAIGLCAGTHGVTVTDSAGCVLNSSASVAEPTAVNIQLDALNNVSCNASADGSIAITVTGGTLPYSYAWSNGLGIQDPMGLDSGNYSVTVTDANGCTATANYTISEPADLIINSLTHTDVVCFGLRNGTALVSATDGTPPYSYAWSDPLSQNTVLADSLFAGVYTVRVTDANGCQKDSTVQIEQPNELKVDIVSQASNCGQADGVLAASTSGGTLPYSFLWSGGVNSIDSTVSNISTGFYAILVTDANGCEDTSSIAVNDISGPVASLFEVEHVSCFGSTDGYITMAVQNGTPPLQYSWNDPLGQQTPTATGLGVGTYTGIVTDVNNCADTLVVQVLQPDELILGGTQNNATCSDNCDGLMTALVNGGAYPYSYSWSHDGSETDSIVNNVCAGTYTLTVSDTNNCQESRDFTVGYPNIVISLVSSQDANCGQSDGTAEVTVGGGTAPYTYLWNDSLAQTTAAVTDLKAGLYKVVVTDANGCSDSLSVNISDQDGPTLTLIDQEDASCFGILDGEAEVSVSGGTAPYTYSWNDPSNQTTARAIGLGAGNYSVAVRDQSGCISTIDVTINQPTQVEASLSLVSDATCYGVCNGIGIAQGEGGMGGYTYLWNDPSAQTSSSASGLCPGAYQVIVTDSTGCADTADVTIGEPDSLQVTITSTIADCHGDCDGQLTAAVSGGTTPYSYQWNDPASQVAPVAGSLCAGTYLLQVTDANGCTRGKTAILAQPDELQVTATSVVHERCDNECNGGVTVVGSGGTGSYSYWWLELNSSGTSVNGICPGSYSVEITDINGCKDTLATDILQSSPININFTASNVTCFGECDGRVVASVSGGTSPYQLQWDDTQLQTTSTAINLCAGMYHLRVEDSVGCQYIDSIQITQPSEISAQINTQDANCGQADGLAWAVMQSGQGPFTFLWTDPAAQTGDTATGLRAGNYQLFVTDQLGCQDSFSVSLNDVAGPDLAVLVKNDVICHGDSSGSVSLSVSGGAQPFTFAWTGPVTANTISAVDLPVGMYEVTVTDSNNCQSNTQFEITQPEKMRVSIIDQKNLSCFESCDGEATALVVAGTAPYQYQWNDPAQQTTAKAANLCEGVYGVSVVDSNNCHADTQVVISQPPIITTITTGQNTHCGQADGIAETFPQGGVGSFSYSWNDPATQTTARATGLLAGEYVVTITDVSGCAITDTVVLIDQQGVQADWAAIHNPLCNGSEDGILEVSAYNGFPPYTYTWTETSSSSARVDNLTIGSYTVVVSDSVGCKDTLSANLVEPSSLTIALTKGDPRCYGDSTGFASALVGGGTKPYEFKWNDYSQSVTQIVYDLPVGTFEVEVTDSNGCTITESITLGQPDSLRLTTAVSHAHCGNSDGSVTVYPEGGTSPYVYQWNDAFNQTSSTATSLIAGSYTVVVTDALGCSSEITVDIQDIEGPKLTVLDIRDVSCFGGQDGLADVEVNGGVQPYIFEWNDPFSQVTPIATNLKAGEYSVVVTDDVGCKASVSVEINEPDSIRLFMTSDPTLCYGSCDGKAHVAAIGGTGSFSYEWDDPDQQTLATANGLCARIYNVLATDANGCMATRWVQVDNAPALTGYTTTEKTRCYGSCDGSAEAFVSGGAGFYQYSWNDVGGQTASHAQGLCAGDYEVSVVDNNGCQILLQATVLEADSFYVEIPQIFSATCAGYCDGAIVATANGGTAPYEYQWNDPLEQKSAQARDLCTGLYKVFAVDANGCLAYANGFVDEPQPMVGNMYADQVSCAGDCDGVAGIQMAGGTEPYTYQWNDLSLQTDKVATDLCEGEYTVSVIDANGCGLKRSILVGTPNPLSASVGTDNANCGQSNGEALAVVSGGTGPYTYQWNDSLSQITREADSLKAGSYLVVVTDANGCQAQATAVINDIEAPSILLTELNHVLCYQDSNASAGISVSGGIAPYDILWNDPFAQTSLTATQLKAGGYVVQVTDQANCRSYMAITVNEPARLVSSITGILNPSCNLACDGIASVIAAGGTRPYEYQWSDPEGQDSSTAMLLCHGTYSVVVKDSNNCISTDTVSLVQPEPLLILADIEDVKCYQQNDGEIVADVNGGTSPYTYLWLETGYSGPHVTGLGPGEYTLLVTDLNGCNLSRGFSIDEPAPVLVETTSSPTTCGKDNGSATVNVSGGTGPYSVQWQPSGDTTFIAAGLAGGTNYVKVLDANQCELVTEVEVYEIRPPLIERLRVDAAECYQGSDGSAEVEVKFGTPPLQYNWSPYGGQEPLATGLSAGLYVVTITDKYGCITNGYGIVSEPADIEVFPRVSEDSLCVGEETLLSAGATGGNGGYKFIWNTGDTIQVHEVNPDSTFNYEVFVEDKNGCLSQPKELQVYVHPPVTVEIMGDTSLCSGDTVTLTSLAEGGLGSDYTYRWILGDTTDQMVVSPEGDMQYIVIATDSCSLEAQDTFSLAVNDRPVVFIDEILPDGCAPLTAELEALSDIGVEFTWYFSNGDSIDGAPVTHLFQESGFYDVVLKVRSAEGCETIREVEDIIKVYELPDAGFVSRPGFVSLLSSKVAFVDSSSNNVTNWEWDFGDPNSADNILVDTSKVVYHQYSDTGSYEIFLTVFTEHGCRDTATRRIYIEPDYDLSIPNAFSPGDDGENDVFKPVRAPGISEDGYKFFVYSRWGDQLFFSTNFNEGWDGTSGGKEVPPGVYVWRLRTRDILGQNHEYIGTVTLLR